MESIEVNELLLDLRDAALPVVGEGGELLVEELLLSVEAPGRLVDAPALGCLRGHSYRGELQQALSGDLRHEPGGDVVAAGDLVPATTYGDVVPDALAQLGADGLGLGHRVTALVCVSILSARAPGRGTRRVSVRLTPLCFRGCGGRQLVVGYEYALAMTDTQLLREVLAELKKITKKLDELNTAASGIEGAVWDTAPQ